MQIKIILFSIRKRATRPVIRVHSKKMCQGHGSKKYQRLHLVFNIAQNSAPMELKEIVIAHGFQVRYITFLNPIVDPVGAVLGVSCPQLQVTRDTPAFVTQLFPITTTFYAPLLLTIPKNLIDEHQDYPPVCFEEERRLNQLQFYLSNELGYYDTTTFNAANHCVLGIDFFIESHSC